ncbi:MAG: carboxypeptidase-like regulatory domain-containing protein [Chloroflexi bacterium]|nr:carboxypeptidase-like regulatory domain-containing protein [Chloroflexota bacterium]
MGFWGRAGRGLALIILLALAACSGVPPLQETPPGANAAALPAPGATPLPPSPTPASPADIPLVFRAARQALADALGLPAGEVELLAREPVDWPDSCLGAPRPGEMCAEVITPGYDALFSAGGVNYRARLDKSGAHFRFDPDPAVQQGESGVEGMVTLGPACPGPVRVDSPCPDEPYQATMSVLDAQEKLVLQFQSDAEGKYRQPLPPGLYTLHPESPDALPYAEDVPVLVQAGQFTRVDIHYDSGIR